MPRAILFDFDGVLADTESLHFEAYRDLLLQEKISLTKEEYYSEFLGLDDRGCFRAVCEKAGRSLPPQKLKEMVKQKNIRILQLIENSSLLLPHVREVLSSLREPYYLAIVSGALRNEILAILKKEGIDPCFRVIVSADEIRRGKPDPEGFLAALRLLNRDHVPESELLLPEECLVVEDSPWGIEAARRAGMISVAVTNSYKKEDLKVADRVISSLSDLQAVLEGL